MALFNRSSRFEMDSDENSQYDFLLDFEQRYNLSRYDRYFHNHHFHYHMNRELHKQNITKTQYWLTFTTDLTNVFLVPCTIIISFLLNLICISIFTSSYVKSTFYKYLSANSVIDCITLMVALLGLFVYSETYTPTQYLFIYISFTSLTISNFIKIALSLDRIFRLKKVAKWYVKKGSFKWIMGVMVVVSALINCPKLIFYNLYSNTLNRNSFLSLTLTVEGKETVKGPMLIISTILIELVPYTAVILLNIVLLTAVKDHLQTLMKIEESSKDENESSKITSTRQIRKKRIHFDIYDEDDSEEETAVDIVVIVNIESDSAIEANTNMDNNEVKINKKEPIDMRTDIEITRFSLTKMLQLSYIVYILGHSLFVFTSIFIQVKYFFYYGPLMDLFKKNLLTINLLIAFSYWFLYISFGVNFFVYFAFNGLFRKIITRSAEEKDKKDAENPNELARDEYSIGANF